MGLFQKALETYECFANKAGIPQEGHATLMPISHIMQKAQVEISIDINGNFGGAALVDKENQKTIIPATVESAGRSGKVIAPHPLSDQLQYLAPFNDKETEKYETYIKQLETWADSAYSHPKVKAVLQYIKNGTILKDLAANDIVALDAGGKLISDKGYEKYMIRWRVLGDSNTDITACWEDTTLFSAYISYYDSLIKNKDEDLSMLDGTMDVILENNPKGIVAANYGAKLISANDSSGFTYRGRFTEGRQAATVGYHASQKAHNALQWLANDQGVIIGGRTFICWNPKGNKIPAQASPLGFSNRPKAATPTNYIKDLQQTILSFRNALPANDDVVIASFDAATTGRLSVVYYNELKASDFLDRVEHWYQTCCWYNWYEKQLYVQSPTITDIARFAFGVERKGENKIEIDDKVYKEQVQRLYRCVVDAVKIPLDIVKALTNRASMPLAYEFANRSKLLFITCAVIRKYRNDILNKEEWTMSLNADSNDRSYQFGRLLAVMEKIERDTYDKDEMREPNAIRMQSVFCERPLHVSRVLNERLISYMERLPVKSRAFYRSTISAIMDKISANADAEINKPLEDTYFLGYYLQRQELYKPVNKE